MLSNPIRVIDAADDASVSGRRGNLVGQIERAVRMPFGDLKRRLDWTSPSNATFARLRERAGDDQAAVYVTPDWEYYIAIDRQFLKAAIMPRRARW